MVTSTTFDELRNVFLGWVRTITGRIVILANAGQGPKGNSPYVVGLFTVSSVPNFQNSTLSQDGLTETIRAATTVSLQLDFYGGNAMQGAYLLISSLKAQARWRDIFTICGVANVQSFRDLTFLETGVRKQRAQVVLEISCNLSEDFASDFITGVPIDLETEDGVIEEDIPGGEDPRKKAPICPT